MQLRQLWLCLPQLLLLSLCPSLRSATNLKESTYPSTKDTSTGKIKRIIMEWSSDIRWLLKGTVRNLLISNSPFPRANYLLYRDQGHPNPWYDDQYYGCRVEGLLCGAYHVANPTQSNGQSQAIYFISHGGGWYPDEKTLPGAVVLGYKHNGPTCYGRSPLQLVTWIRNFSIEYHSITTRYPVIVTTKNWWKECTNNEDEFSPRNALWQANEGERPRGWSRTTFLETKPQTQTEVGHIKWNGTPQDLNDFVSNKV